MSVVVCLLLLVVMIVVVVCVRAKLVSIVTMPCCPTKQLIIMLVNNGTLLNPWIAELYSTYKYVWVCMCDRE